MLIYMQGANSGILLILIYNNNKNDAIEIQRSF